MSESEVLRVEKEGHIAWLILNRPKKRNAMNLEMLQGFIETFDRLDADPEVRVVVIKGEGLSFCAGMELAALAGLLESSSADYRERLRREIVRFQHGMTIVEQCRKPVIAAIHGACVGGGVDLTCACDIRVASRDAFFSVRETRLALVADLGTLQRLPYIVGDPWARELALTGRDFSAEEALKIGFITHLLENQAALYQKAEELAREIADCSPLAVTGVKDTLRFTRENGVKAGLEYVAQKNAAILICEDGLEAITAHQQKRKPKFKGC
ncbi:MAG: crotonase/enoyl-CoA hydratase family protein [Thermodesulfobacteriota bacterium]